MMMRKWMTDGMEWRGGCECAGFFFCVWILPLPLAARALFGVSVGLVLLLADGKRKRGGG